MDPFINNYIKAALASNFVHDSIERSKIDRAAVAMGWGMPVPPDLVTTPDLPAIHVHKHPKNMGLLGYILLIVAVSAFSSLCVLGAVYFARGITQYEVQWNPNDVKIQEK